MPAPKIYDLSYQLNSGGLYIPFEYISNFTAGSEMAIVRQIVNQPQDIQSVTMVVKASQGAPSLVLSKTATPVLDLDGQILLQADRSVDLTFLFSPADTLLLDSKNYFFLSATYTDNTTNIFAQGYIQAGLEQNTPGGTPAQILILNPVGQISVGQLQIQTQVNDSLGNELLNVPLFYFSSDINEATVSDTGLIDALAATSEVVITVGTTRGNLATRATLSIV